MRTSCGRSDGKPANQATEIPRAYAFLRRLSPYTDYYNRLESSRRFRLLCAAARLSSRLLSAVAIPPDRIASGASRRFSASRPFLSFPQGRESCHKQFWCVTPFRRGIA